MGSRIIEKNKFALECSLSNIWPHQKVKIFDYYGLFPYVSLKYGLSERINIGFNKNLLILILKSVYPLFSITSKYTYIYSEFGTDSLNFSKKGFWNQIVNFKGGGIFKFKKFGNIYLEAEANNILHKSCMFYNLSLGVSIDLL